MSHELFHRARGMPRRAGLAGLAAGLSLLGCVAVCWTDSMAYADLSNARLERMVGVKGDCCVPGLKTTCESQPSFACVTSGVVGCESGTSAFDSCGDPSCKDSDSSNDHCGSSECTPYSITSTTCTVISSAIVVCGDNGQQCHFVTATATVDFTGCGTANICSVTSGVACQ